MILATRVALVVSVVSLVLANTLGLSLGVGWLSYTWRPAHAHLNLLGFVTSMIFGVGYHAVPRFRGVPFKRPRLALAQVIVHAAGLLGMVLSFGFVLGPAWLGTFGALTWLSSLAFALIMIEVVVLQPRPRRGA
jgi:cbb3-type cytochrome oxidase subunit 1